MTGVQTCALPICGSMKENRVDFILINNTLGKLDSEGCFVTIPLTDIQKILLAGDSINIDARESLREKFPSVHFSQRGAKLEVRFSFDEESRIMTCKVLAQRMGKTYDVTDPFFSGSEHYCDEKIWFPFTDNLESSREFFRYCGIVFPKKIDYSSCLDRKSVV